VAARGFLVLLAVPVLTVLLGVRSCPPNSPHYAERLRGTAPHEKGLSDRELGELLGVSNLILRDYRVKGKKPPAGLAKKLQDWEVKGDRWVRKS
jgi:hypothetical protein